MFLQRRCLRPRSGTAIPQLVFFAFQAAFCIVTVALVSGAVVERMRFVPMLVFSASWSVLVYAVLAHWAFGGGWLQAHGTLDFAGGVPVEMGSGSPRWLQRSSSVRARTTAARRCCPTMPSSCCSAPGCCGLAGSASTEAAASPPVIPACSHSPTRCSRRPARCSSGSCSISLRERRVTAIGAATAIIVGCVGITPAGGYISPAWAMALGALAALPSYAIIVWRPRTRVDETLDVLAAHGTAGLTGILFLGFVAQLSWNGAQTACSMAMPISSPGRRSPASPRRPTHSARPSC